MLIKISQNLNPLSVLRKLSPVLIGLLIFMIPATSLAASDPCHPEKDKNGGTALTPTQLKGCEACDKSNSAQNLNNCLDQDPITTDLNTVVNVLSAGVAVVVVGMIIVGGIRYSIAGDNASQLTQAKKTIANALIALFIFIFIFAFLQWIIPGGLFG